MLDGMRGAERTTERIARMLYEHGEALAVAYGEPLSGVAWDDLPAQRRALLAHAVGNCIAEGLIRLPVDLPA